ncbi:uncharacterized protein LOC132404485 [Hypanus sabinus]|uniref:uncharacterized protein LOC132404485 n=1 Tax=Hypanus sabinus TaxID=79690 RepID=UPI0028C49E2D|nr:uncharacterized protein LOC132404485 [Hypanus sabinus]
MEPVLRPDRLDLDPQDPDAALTFEHWLACFQSYLAELRATEPAVMHRILLSRVSSKVYSFIRDLPTYEGALDALKRQYLRPVNTVYARHRLATRQQRPGESCAEFLRALQTLVRACDCKTLTAEQHAELLVRDAFVTGLRSVYMRQRLLENSDLTLSSAIEKANALEAARHNADAVQSRDSPPVSWTPQTPPPPAPGSEFANAAASRDSTSSPTQTTAVARKQLVLCYFCGQKKHPRQRCPAREATCSSCGKRGHFAKVCKSQPRAECSAAGETWGPPSCMPGCGRPSLSTSARPAPDPRMLTGYPGEPSTSPWRAQVVVVRTGQKNRMVVDYSQTINRFTQLDAYPLPRIADMVNQIAQYKVYSTIDLKSAYHQLPICPEDRPYTAFEAGGRLYHFLRVPFGVTNGVSVFQREMDRMVDQYQLQATFPYLDNITICGHDRPDHDANLQRFLQVAAALNLTYNRDKCVFGTTRLAILGYVVENGVIGPDPERMRPLLELPLPTTLKALRRCLGFFSYYAQWVPHYADKARPLVKSTSFPLSAEACAAFNCIKADIAKATMHAVDETAPFQVECDASDFALAATLNQEGRPVAFFSRTLQGSEIRHSAVEKEAQAIVEAVRHWRHYLAGKRFTVLTDQRSVAFLFSNQQRGKIKNDKLLRWRIELSTYTYDILYRPGRLNEPPDALSRGTCASTQLDQLYALHAQLCHPGVTRFYHFVKARNLPYSLEDIRTMTRDCQICAECKPHFYCPDTAQLVKATRPFERLSVDFKGPLPSTDRNVYFLSVIDEFSRIPFAIPCPDTTATSVIKALRQLFTLFGYPCYIHSDRGSSFMSEELRQYLLARGIATSRTTSYNPRGNGQVERENATVWKATLLALKSKGLPVSRWQEVLPEALHSIRSLLCTSTNATPHERLFSFPRKSVTGTTLPVWLTSPGPVLLRKHVRSNKYSPLVERVHLLHANPQYAYVVLPDGREDTVSIRDLAPAGAADHYPEGSPVTVNPAPEVAPYSPGPTQTPHDTCIPGVSYAFIPGASHMHEGSPAPSGQEHAQPPSPVQSPMLPAPMRSQPVLCRSQRQIRPPDRLDL